MPPEDSKRILNWEIQLLLARVAALLLSGVFLQLGIVIVLSVALSAIQLYPLGALRFFGAEVAEEDIPPTERERLTG
jgi:hypothetical protein